MKSAGSVSHETAASTVVLVAYLASGGYDRERSRKQFTMTALCNHHVKVGMAPASVDILALLNATERAAVGRGAQSVTTTNPNPREAETDSEKSDQKEKEASSSASSSAEPSTEPRFELINDPVDEQPPKEGRIRKFVRKVIPCMNKPEKSRPRINRSQTPSPILRNVSTTGFRNVRVDANSRARVLTEEDKKQLGKNNQLSWNLVSRPIPPAQD